MRSKTERISKYETIKTVGGLPIWFKRGGPPTTFLFCFNEEKE